MSAGLTLKSFLVTTTDENFTPQFVDRTKDKEHHMKVSDKCRGSRGFSPCYLKRSAMLLMDV